VSSLIFTTPKTKPVKNITSYKAGKHAGKPQAHARP
jgi:hypothetical protein